MKLFRFGAEGAEKPGLILRRRRAGRRVGVRRGLGRALLRHDGLARLATWEGATPLARRACRPARAGPAVARPSKIVCIGLNYRGHAAETGAAIPAEPVVFLKASTRLRGRATSLLPRGSVKTDWEVELAFVIGKARAT